MEKSRVPAYTPWYRTEFTAFMHLSDHSLRQLDDAYVRSFDPEALCALSVQLLADPKEARERLHQGADQQLAIVERSGTVGLGRDRDRA